MSSIGSRTIVQRSWMAAILVGVLLGLAPAPARAQVADAVIEVFAQDESQAVLPGVTVTVLRPDTGFTQNSVTDGTGVVRFIALQPGTYNVKVELVGLHHGQPGGRHAARRPDGEADADARQVAKVGRDGERRRPRRRWSTSTRPTRPRTSCPSRSSRCRSANRDFQQLAFLAPGVQRERGGFRFVDEPAGHRRRRQREPVDDPRRRRRLHRPDAGPGARASSARTRSASSASSPTGSTPRSAGRPAARCRLSPSRARTTCTGRRSASSATMRCGRKGELDKQKNDYSRQQFGGTIGGPIVKDRTHFFGSFEQVERRQHRAVPAAAAAYASLAADLADPRRPVALLRRRRSPDQRRAELPRQVRLRALPPGELPRGRRGGRDRTACSSTATTGTSPSRTAGRSATRSLNQLSVQVGQRKFDEPNNSQRARRVVLGRQHPRRSAPTSSGDQTDTGKIFEIRDTFYTRIGSGKWAQDLKFGGALAVRQGRRGTSRSTRRAWMIYLNDTRLFPLPLHLRQGRERVVDHDEPGLGLRAGRLPARADGHHQRRPAVRPRHQRQQPGLHEPRDADGAGPRHEQLPAPRRVLVGPRWQRPARRSAAALGLFTGRFLLVPAHSELQQNSYTGYIIAAARQRRALGLPAFALDPNNPHDDRHRRCRTTPARIDDELVNPFATQVTAGYTVRLGTRASTPTSRASTSRATTRSSSAT